MFLYNLPMNQVATIKQINTDIAVKERLHSFGLIRGVAIKPVRVSPLGCPRIYRCLNTNIAIRNNIARQIELL